MKRSGLSLISCAIGISVVIGMDWHSEHASGASVTDSSFDWRNANGANNNFLTSARNQGSSSACWDFAAVGATEAWYKITRNDTSAFANDVWCADLSEQTISDYGDAGTDAAGWNSGLALSLDVAPFPVNGTGNARGIVAESDIPFTGVDPAQPWQLPANLLNRRLHLAGTGNGMAVASNLTAIKTALLSTGPLPFYCNGHVRMAYGWDDANQRFLVKDSASNWNYLSYSDATSAADFWQAAGPAYFNGALNSATWTNAQGNRVWDNKASTNWNQDPDQGPHNPWHGAPTGTWLNGETAATFGSTGSGTVTIANNTSAYGLVVNSAGYVFNGGTLTITGNHDANTNYQNNGGINVHASVTFNNSKITVGAPSTWTVDAGQTLTVNAPVDLHINTLTIDGSGTTNLNGVVSDVVTNPTFNGLLTGYSGSLVKNGAGTLNLNNSGNTFQSLTVNAGTVGSIDSNTLGNNTVVWNGGALSLIGSAPTTLNLGGLAGTASTATLGVNTALNVGGNNANTVYSGVLAGSFALTKTGTGTLALLGTNNSYSGGTCVQGGLIQIGGAGSLGPGAITLDGGGLAFDQTFDFNRPLTINNAINGLGGSLDASTADGRVSGVISGPGGLTKTGGGTVVLAGTNTYAGGTTVNAGVLAVATLDALPNYNTPGKVVVNGGAALTVLNPVDLPTILGKATFNAGSFAGIDTSNGPVSCSNPALPNGVGFAISGPNTLTLSGANTYTGSTMIVSGTLSVSADNNLGAVPSSPTPGKFVISGNGTLLASNTFTLNSNRGMALGTSNGGGTATGTINVAAGKTLTYGGIIANNGNSTGSLVKAGPGTLTLTGTNTYSGDTYLNGGLINASSLSNLGSGSQLVFNGGGLQCGTGFDPSSRTMLFAGNATLDIPDPGNAMWLYHSIGGGGSGSLIKTGPGRLALLKSSDYSGGTTVAGGLLSPRNTTGSATGSGPVTVNSGATLEGWGIIDGPVTVAGTLAPDSCAWTGSLPRILTIDNQVALQPTSTFAVLVNGLTAGTDSGYGQLLTTGPVSLAGSLALTFGNFAPTGHDILFLINNSGSEATLGRFQYADNARIGTFDGLDWYITYGADNGAVPGLNGGNDVAVYDVPEPSGLLLLASGLLSLLAYRWRRRRS